MDMHVTREPQSVRFFSQEMALYRATRAGLVLLNAYCPHMRANIARNTSYVVRDGHQVKGAPSAVRHLAGRFTREGECDDIPYSSRAIPKAACIRSHKWSSVPAPYGCGTTWKASNRTTNSSNPASGTARTRMGPLGRPLPQGASLVPRVLQPAFTPARVPAPSGWCLRHPRAQPGGIGSCLNEQLARSAARAPPLLGPV